MGYQKGLLLKQTTKKWVYKAQKNTQSPWLSTHKKWLL